MGRRSRSEGSIYKRKDGRWCGKYTDANGETRYVYAKTKAEVRTNLHSRNGLDPEAIIEIATRLEQINKEKLLPILRSRIGRGRTA